MIYSLCFVGLDREDEAQPVQWLAKAGVERWQPAPEAEADVLIVDIDTLVGHMSWLKLKRGTRTLVALSVRPEGHARLTLHKPLRPESLAAVLRQLEREFDGLDDASSAPPLSEAEPRSEREPPPASAKPEADEQAPAVEPEAPPAPRLLDYLNGAPANGPARLDTPGAPPLVIDPDGGTYFGNDKLKPYLPHCTRPIANAEWRSVPPESLESIAAELGGRQPLARLRWLAGLSAGNGRLLPPWQPEDALKLNRWLSVEREFPRHFRIATAMMKGGQTLAQIAEASQTPEPDVADFINAAHTIGAVEREA